MKNFLNRLWLRLLSSPLSDVEQIAVLQKNAANCRAEFAEEARTADMPIAGARSHSRKRMEAAEVAYRLALQRWENKQSRQKLG